MYLCQQNKSECSMESNENIQWDKIREVIINSVKHHFIPMYNQTLSDVVDMYIQVICLPIHEEKLSAIPKDLSTSLQRFYVDKTDRPIHFKIIAHVESFLRKVLYLVKREEYDKITNTKDGLAKVITLLELNPNHINLSKEEEELEREERKFYGVHLLRAYKRRNIESHEAEALEETDLLDFARSAIIMCLYAINKHSIALSKQLTKADSRRSSYLAKVEEDFKNWNMRFVPINGREQFQEIAIYAVEANWDDRKQETAREGEVEQLRQELIAAHQNQMIIQGEAGMGKTTTMKYLAYRDAKAGKLPIYIELKLLIKDETLSEIIKKRLEMISSDIEGLMQTTDTCIFFDGLNEIDPALKGKTFREIELLMARYPKVFFLISTRPQDYEGQLGAVPVFSLQKMDIAKIREFLKKNTNDTKVRETIIGAINENENWLRILGTPLILYMLIQVVSKEGELPDDENKIIIKFIKGLYDREQRKDYSFNKVYFHYIMSMIAFECIDKIGNTNTGFSFIKAKKLISDETVIEDRKLMEILQKGVELTLLVQDENLYSFSHQSYQETLAGDYFNNL